MRSLAVLTLMSVAAPRPAPAAPTEPRIEVQGHRGARAMRPENTLPAFGYALEVGADVLELDVVVTRDDRLVVAHDPHVSPALCTGPKGRPVPEGLAIRSLTLAELRRFDCGAKKNPRFPEQVPAPGARIPTLEEVLDFVAKHEAPAAKTVGFNIETKIEPAHPELFPTPARFAGLLVQTLEAKAVVDRAVVQSFDARPLRAVRAKNPKIRIAMLISDNAPPLVPIAKDLGAAIISPHHEWITKAAVAELHAAGVRVVPWTANDEAAWARLVKMEVDGIITDDPARLIAYLKRRGLR